MTNSNLSTLPKQEELERVCYALRQKCYRSMFLMDSDYLDDYTSLISEVSAACKHLLTVETQSPMEEALICLTVLIGYNVTIRNEENITNAVDRAKTVLPQLEDDRLKAHLNIYIYGETEDEQYADEAHRLFSQFPKASLTEEDKWALQSLEDIAHSSLTLP